MKVILNGIILVLVVLGSGCSINHHVAKDYEQYLVNNMGKSELPVAQGDYDTYRVSPETQHHRYEFRSVMSGYGNLWIVEFGQILDTTLQSEDVQNAFNGLERAGDGKTPGNVLVFELLDYEFSDFSAKVEMGVSVYAGAEKKFSRVYNATGKSQGGKVFWGGAFSTKNAVQQSTKLAVDEILQALIKDLNVEEVP